MAAEETAAREPVIPDTTNADTSSALVAGNVAVSVEPEITAILCTTVMGLDHFEQHYIYPCIVVELPQLNF